MISSSSRSIAEDFDHSLLVAFGKGVQRQPLGGNFVFSHIAVSPVIRIYCRLVVKRLFLDMNGGFRLLTLIRFSNLNHIQNGVPF